MSDLAADIGVEQHGSEFLEASTFFVATQKEYGGFMKGMLTLILAIMKEAAALRNPLKPGVNHEVYKKICKGLSSELFQPTWSLPYPELPDCLDLIGECEVWVSTWLYLI